MTEGKTKLIIKSKSVKRKTVNNAIKANVLLAVIILITSALIVSGSAYSYNKGKDKYNKKLAWQIGDIEESKKDNPWDEFGNIEVKKESQYSRNFKIGKHDDNRFPKKTAPYCNGRPNEINIKFTLDLSKGGYFKFGYTPGATGTEIIKIFFDGELLKTFKDKGKYYKNNYCNFKMKEHKVKIPKTDCGEQKHVITILHEDGDGAFWDYLLLEDKNYKSKKYSNDGQCGGSCGGNCGGSCGHECGPGTNKECGECKGGVTYLKLRYLGSNTANIEVTEKKGKETFFQGTVAPGGTFEFYGTGKDGKLGTEISIYINGQLNTKIHTSCSKPIGIGMVFGSFEIIDGASKDGGPFCGSSGGNGGCDDNGNSYPCDGTCGGNCGGGCGGNCGDPQCGNGGSNGCGGTCGGNCGGGCGGNCGDPQCGNGGSNGCGGHGGGNGCGNGGSNGCGNGGSNGCGNGGSDGCNGNGGNGGTSDKCGECKGGIIYLKLKYTGSKSYPTIRVGDKKGKKIFYEGKVGSGGVFSFSGTDKDGKMGSEISIFVNGQLNTKIHTSCSKPIGRGMVSGDFKIIDGESKDGGRLPLF